MSEMTLFKGKMSLPAMPADFVDPVTDRLAGSRGSGRRISIKGKAFRQIVNGDEVYISEENLLDVVIINAAPISRTYYAEEYQEGASVPPTCWSSDTVTPDADVPEEDKVSKTCATCPMNVAGSGKGDSRACRFAQRVAVVLDGEIEEEQVYQMQLPATSIFGDAEGNKMGLQAYARYLKANNANAIALVTRLKFDIAATQPKLFFSAVRPLTQEELDICLSLREHPDTLSALTMTVGETDGAKRDKNVPAKTSKVAQEEDEDDEAPVRAPKKKAPPAKKAPEPEYDEDDDAEEEEEPAPPVRKPAAKKSAVPAKKAPVVLDEEDEEDEEPPEPVKAPRKKAPPVEEPAELDDLLGEWDD